MPLTVLSIAGTDPLQGAGVGADMRVFEAFGCYGLTLETAIVNQTSQGVHGFQAVDAGFLQQRLQRLRDDCPIHAIKIGMSASSEILEMLRQEFDRWPNKPFTVLDPVLKSGGADNRALFQDRHLESLRSLLPYVDLLTPNALELSRLSELPVRRLEDALCAAQKLHQQGVPAVLIKGGHLEERGRDMLSEQGCAPKLVFDGSPWPFEVHGTGCHLSSAIAALRARGLPLWEACTEASAFVHGLVHAGAVVQLGQGRRQFDAHRFAEQLRHSSKAAAGFAPDLE